MVRNKTKIMAKTLLLLIIAFVALDFVLSSVLSWLNTRWMTHPVPPELEGLYDEEKYRKQQDYMRTNKRVSLVARCVSFALTLVILGCGLKKLASHGLSNLTPHPLVVWFSYSHPTLAQRIRAIRAQH